jgi:flagellar protein FliS
MENKNDYVLRIATATPAELVVVTYEMLLDSLGAAMTAESEALFGEAAKHAKDLLDELIVSLDMDYEISRELLPIYIYVNKLLMESMQKRDTAPLAQADRIMRELLASWRAAAEQDKKSQGESADEAGKVYTGLMYDKDGRLVETESGDMSRTFEG